MFVQLTVVRPSLEQTTDDPAVVHAILLQVGVICGRVQFMLLPLSDVYPGKHAHLNVTSGAKDPAHVVLPPH